MIQTLGTTTNFIIQYDDAFAFAKERAQALQQNAEADFATLRGWFQNTSGFGPSNRVTLLVDTKSLAWNSGYRTNGTTLVIMNHFNSQGADPLADDAVVALFVAEIIEVLMGCRDQQTGTVTWNAGHSDGEGLSRMAAGLLHPASYYSQAYLKGPYINEWLQSAARQDWITQTEPTDQHVDSIGCSLLFLYYIYSQLNYSMPEIITNAGTTLAETFKNLTGITNAYTHFTNFLAPYFPIGDTAVLASDDPFPILKGQQRTVQLTFLEVSNGANSLAGSGTVEVSPFFLCPIKAYTYQLLNMPLKLRCTATVSGFAQPQFTWTVNGVAAGNGTITPTATIYTDIPNEPGTQNSTIEAVPINCFDIGSTSTYLAVSDELDIINDNYPGHEQLMIRVTVREKYASTDTITVVGTMLLDAQTVVYDAQFYIDKAKCKAAFWAMIPRLQGEAAYNPIPIVLTLPDPPPDLYNAAKTIEQIVNGIATLARTDPKLADQLATAIAGALRVSPRLFGTFEV